MELSAAREHFARCQQALGEAIEDAADAAAANRAMVEAKSVVEQLETALAVALHRQSDAETALKNAELLASTETELFDIARLKYQVMPRFDAWLKEGERLVQEEVGPALDAARQTATVDTSWVMDVQLAIKLYVFKSLSVLIPEGRAYMPSIAAKTLADRVIDPEFVRARRRPR